MSVGCVLCNVTRLCGEYVNAGIVGALSRVFTNCKQLISC